MMQGRGMLAAAVQRLLVQTVEALLWTLLMLLT
jgi:hypothetical protein